MTATLQRLITAEEFAEFPEPEPEQHDELVRGIIAYYPLPTVRHGHTSADVGYLLGKYVDQNDIGVVTMRVGVVTGRNPDTVRAADLAFWMKQRWPRCIERDDWTVVPDIAIDIRDRWDTPELTALRARDFLEAGVRLVWVVEPDSRSVMVYRPGERGIEYSETDTLDGGDVLPGFTCPVASLFE